MLSTILSLYLQSLIIAILVVVVLSLIWFVRRAVKGLDTTLEARHQVLYDLLLINLLTIPIVSFGILGILLMLRV